MNKHMRRVPVPVEDVEVGRKHSVTRGIYTSYTAEVM